MSILDNLCARKTSRVEEFLKDHPEVHLHFTPSYSSWLNQVEIWFARRSLLAAFTSIRDLARKLMRYTRAYSIEDRTTDQVEILRYHPPGESMLTKNFTATSH